MIKPSISIVIPTFNRCKELQLTLQSLQKQSVKEFEVVIADDGSSDGTAKVAQASYSFPVQYVVQPNQGRAAARNMGIAKAQADIILFIDDHIICHKDLVKYHLETHRKSSVPLGAVRGRVDFIKQPTDAPEHVPKKKYKYRSVQSPFVTFITNNISVSRRALALTGGFDPDFKEYGFQDQELGYRIRQRGFRFIMAPKAVGYIFSVAELSTEKRLDKHRQAGRSAALLYRKHFWGGLQVGVNPFNIAWYWLTSINNDWLLNYYQTKMQKNTGNKKKFDYWFYKLRAFQPRSGKQVVMLVSHQSDLSGAPISLVILANRLAAAGYQPILVLPGKGPIETRIDTNTVTVVYIPKSYKAFWLYLLLARFRPQLLHANTFLCEYALDVAKRFPFIKRIIHIREDLRSFPGVARRISAKADRVILISHSMVQEYNDPYKLEVIYNALDTIPEEQSIGGAEEPYNVLYVGSIEKRKGLFDLVKAIAIVYKENKRVTLSVLGRVLEQAYYRQLQYFIQKKGLQDVVHFYGTTPLVHTYMDKASIVVVPSLSEPFGRVVIEAMSRKKLVIGTNVGGIPEIITPYDTGFLVDPAEPEALARMIQYVWAKPSDQKQAMKHRAYEDVKKRFFAESYVARVVDCYQKVLEGQ
jgi:glycosyltransferase involved in cell wall biosynthesis